MMINTRLSIGSIWMALVVLAGPACGVLDESGNAPGEEDAGDERIELTSGTWTFSYGAWGLDCYDNVSYLTAHGVAKMVGCGVDAGLAAPRQSYTYIFDISGVAANEDVAFQTRMARLNGTWVTSGWHSGSETSRVSYTSCVDDWSLTRQCRVRSGICTGTGCAF
jgi:hypothetical protein